MQSEITNININVIKPLNDEELILRFTEAIFKVIKKKIPPQHIESFIDRLSCEIDSDDITCRRDNHEDSSNL